MVVLSKLFKIVECKRISIFTAILCVSYILSAQQTSSEMSRTGEFLIDTNAVYGILNGEQLLPSIAFDGTNYLVVWQDSRGAYCDIYGARVNPNGVIVDSAGIAICCIDDYQNSPSVSFDGVNFLVVWSDRRSEKYEIYGARVTTTGIVIDTAGFLIATTNSQYNFSSPSVAFDGRNYLVVWDGIIDGIQGVRVSSSGIVLDSTFISIMPRGFQPSVASNGMNFLIVGLEGDDIYGVRVNADGIVLDTIGFLLCNPFGEQRVPSVASDGLNYFVVWTDSGATPVPCIFGTRVSPSGIVLDTLKIPISINVHHHASPSIGFCGSCYFVLWSQTFGNWGIFGARVTPTGIVLDLSGILISNAMGNQEYPAVSSDNENYFVVWQDTRNQTSNHTTDIYGSRISQNGIVLDPDGIIVSTGLYDQWNPSVIFNGTDYFATWEDWRSLYSWNIYGTRISQYGTILDPNGIAITNGTRGEYAPTLATDGTDYFVAWHDHRPGVGNTDIYGARISSNGILLDSAGIAISTASSYQYYPSVTFDGSNYFVVWMDYRASGSKIYGARVTPSGTVLDPTGIIISLGNYSGLWYPSVAYDGTNYLVVWSYSSVEIHCARVSPAGVVLDSIPIVICSATNNQWAPAVAYDGANYFVVWQDERNGSDYDIYGSRVSKSGVVLDSAGIAICNATNDQQTPAVVFDGTDYLVVWEDFRCGLDCDIYAAKLDTSGMVIDSFEMLKYWNNQINPALTRGQGNHILMIYSGFCEYINNHPANTMRIWGQLWPFLGINEDKGYVVQTVQDEMEIYPNPFTIKTTIEYTMHDAGYRIKNSSLKIYDISGRLVRSFNHITRQLFNQLTWLGDDNAGNKLPAGIYFVQLSDGDQKQIRKVVLLE